jgi:hypothetical protein
MTRHIRLKINFTFQFLFIFLSVHSRILFKNPRKVRQVFEADFYNVSAQQLPVFRVLQYAHLLDGDLV